MWGQRFSMIPLTIDIGVTVANRTLVVRKKKLFPPKIIVTFLLLKPRKKAKDKQCGLGNKYRMRSSFYSATNLIANCKSANKTQMPTNASEFLGEESGSNFPKKTTCWRISDWRSQPRGAAHSAARWSAGPSTWPPGRAGPPPPATPRSACLRCGRGEGANGRLWLPNQIPFNNKTQITSRFLFMNEQKYTKQLALFWE